MAQRITETMLVRLLQGINRAEGRPQETVQTAENGRRYFSVGNLCLDGAYGGVAVVEMTSEFGAQSHHYPSGGGHVPKREVYYYLQGRLDAAHYAYEQRRQMAEVIEGLSNAAIVDDQTPNWVLALIEKGENLSPI